MLLTSTLSGLEIFAGSSYRGSICPTGAKIGSSYRAFREKAISMETRLGSRYREVREMEGSRNRDSTVFMSLNLLFRLSTRNGAIINKNSQTV